MKRGAGLKANSTVGYRRTPLQIARSSPQLTGNIKAHLACGAKDEIIVPVADLPLHASVLSRKAVRLDLQLQQGRDPNTRSSKNDSISALLLASAIVAEFNETTSDALLFAKLIN